MPVTTILEGRNLGERHCYFNRLVYEYCSKNVNFETLPDFSPVDKLLKIDVANQQKHVEYIIQTLKEHDLLYVCRALKCSWLIDLEYSHIINPMNLENNIYPYMIKPAVKKMKHWIKSNLKNPQRCEEFYNHYKNDFVGSIAYLKNCSTSVVFDEVANNIEKLTPQHLNMLCQVNPSVAKVYFECMLKNNNAILTYRNSEFQFLNSLKCILKLDGNLYLDLIESYLTGDHLSPSATRYIMKNFKFRYTAKQELYASEILDIDTLASCLTANECRDLVIHLSKAEYLQHWFSYKSMEPFIKRLPLQERAGFKKLIFIDKDIGHKIKEWPYDTPSCPNAIDLTDNIFEDNENDYFVNTSFGMKRCFAMPVSCCRNAMGNQVMRIRTLLDQLFDKYRFAGFSKTYIELKNRLQAESTIEGRQNILLVLISKSGGVLEHVETLMKLLTEKHKNEPNILRATIVRSLVKRLNFWRMPDNIWNLMLVFAHDLGLDGHDSDLLCTEGLHAVILRNILNGTTPTPHLMKAYINNFTTFKDYGLKGSEILQMKKHLPSLLQEYPKEFVDIVSVYNIKNIKNLEDKLAKSAIGNRDWINCLFEKGIARRQLIAETFTVNQFEASYINALRHNPSLLGEGKIFASLASKEHTSHTRFLQKLKIYFGEDAGLADQHLAALNDAFNTKPTSRLVRPIAILSCYKNIMKNVEKLRENHCKANLKLALAFKNNIHLCKPHINIDEVDWKIFGLKALGNKILINKSCSLENNIKTCLKYRGTMSLALWLALNTAHEVETFSVVSARRPKVAIKVAVSYYFNGSLMPPQVWKMIKEIILLFQYEKLPRKILERLNYNSEIPKNIKADYWATVYQALIRVDRNKAMRPLCMIEYLLPQIDKEILRTILDDFIKHDISIENLTNYHNLFLSGQKVQKRSNLIDNRYMCMYMRIIAKYSLLATTGKEQTEILRNTVTPLFNAIEKIWKVLEDKSYIVDCLDAFLKSLKYNAVFTTDIYEPCMPVFTTIVSLLSAIMPRKEYFQYYTKIHFTILYHDAIKYALKQNARCFDVEDKSEVMETVGTKFGEYVGNGIVELVDQYFLSVTEIYQEGLQDFLTEYIPEKECSSKFIATVTKGIMKIYKLEAYLVAEHIYRENKNNWTKETDIKDALQSCKYNEVKFFLSQENFAVSSNFQHFAPCG